MFERFARGGGAGRRSGSDGAGLGLALVDEHVRMHGGRVWVEDRADGEPGARFVIELPATEVATNVTPSAAAEFADERVADRRSAARARRRAHRTAAVASTPIRHRATSLRTNAA